MTVYWSIFHICLTDCLTDNIACLSLIFSNFGLAIHQTLKYYFSGSCPCTLIHTNLANITHRCSEMLTLQCFCSISYIISSISRGYNWRKVRNIALFLENIFFSINTHNFTCKHVSNVSRIR